MLVAVVPYIGFVMALHGWFSASWTNAAGALASLREVRFLPFYYHYFTTESAALQSLLRIAAAYLPVGIGCWLWRFGARRTCRGGAWIPAVLAALLALVMEAGRLFVPGKRPDPTDILIAAFAAWFGYAAAAAVMRWTSATHGTRQAEAAARRRRGQRSEGVRAAGTVPSGAPAWALLIALAVAPFVLLHPFAGVLASFLAAYAAFLWRYPRAALPAVLALLPLLNFAPWTGWVLVEEFDLLVAVTLAVWLLRRPARPAADPARGRALWAVVLLAASYAVSAVVGLLPFETFDQNALTTYYGSLNSLRVAKGFAWALALLPMLSEEMRGGKPGASGSPPAFCWACSVVIAVALWQRAAMSGLLDFSTDYRIAATFPETHIGGGDVEAYLVMALPFAVAWIALRPVPGRFVAAGAGDRPGQLCARGHVRASRAISPTPACWRYWRSRSRSTGSRERRSGIAASHRRPRRRGGRGCDRRFRS